MDNLKSAIADKILDISSLGGDDVKSKLEKVNRFRDFTNACQSLISRYPAIEIELLRMVESNDFDTKVASARVDTIIRLSEKESTSSVQHSIMEKDIDKLEEITQKVTVEITPQQAIESVHEYIPIEAAAKVKLQTEDADYEEIPVVEDKEYANFEDVVPNNSQDNNVEDAVATVSKLDTAKKVLLVVGIVAAIIALIFIIEFVITNWETILWVLGIGVVLAAAGWYFFKKRKSA